MASGYALIIFAVRPEGPGAFPAGMLLIASRNWGVKDALEFISNILGDFAFAHVLEKLLEVEGNLGVGMERGGDGRGWGTRVGLDVRVTGGASPGLCSRLQFRPVWGRGWSHRSEVRCGVEYNRGGYQLFPDERVFLEVLCTGIECVGDRVVSIEMVHVCFMDFDRVCQDGVIRHV